MLPRTLSSRIALTFSLILAGLIVAQGLYDERRIRGALDRQLEQRLAVAAGLLADDAARAFADAAALESFGTENGAACRGAGLRVTLVRADGEVVYDNEAGLPLTNHAGRPEIRDAFATGHGRSSRRSTSTGAHTFYFARRVELPAEGGQAGVVRVSAPLDVASNTFGPLSNVLLVGTAVILVMGLFGAALLSRWLARPLETIQAAARAVAEGDLERRIRVDGPVEVRRLAKSLNRMADELRARIAGMERSRSETQAILGAMTEGVIAVDADENVVLMNGSAARLLGFPEPLAAGEPLWKVLRFPELEQALRGVLAGRVDWHGDAPSPLGDGGTLRLSAARFGDGSGAVVLLTDVTEIRRTEQVRLDFVANVSHELRTPLAAVIGALETLDEPDQSGEDRARFLDIAQRNSARLLAIVNDLLELSRIETEGDRLPLETIRLEQPVRSAASALQGTAEKQGVKLEMMEPGGGGGPCHVRGNSHLLEQVFTNLIENAIKYTPAGGRVTVRLDGTEKEAAVTVEDTGVGIPPASLPRVFERFYRVDKSRSRGMGGTGLGLAIVKHAVRVHGGRVTVRSDEGHGSAFTVTLPRAPR